MSKKLSDIVKEIEEIIKNDGDLYVQSYQISDENNRSSWYMLSKEKMLKNGFKAKMGTREFLKHVKNLKNKPS